MHATRALPTRTEPDSIIDAARGCEGKSPRERMAMFIDLLETLDIIWQHLSPEERRRRIEINRKIEPSPDPWWRNLRPSAQPKLPLKVSSR